MTQSENGFEWKKQEWDLDSFDTRIPRSVQNYYNGTGAEYLLMASLSRRRLDVAKLPVDYGFDVMAASNASAAHRIQYYFQVKSITAHDGEPSKGKQSNRTSVPTRKSGDAQDGSEGSRYTISDSISISAFSLNLLKNTYPHSALIVYIYDDLKAAGMEPEDMPVTYFWLDYADIESFSEFMTKDGKNGSRSGGYYKIPLQIVYPESDRQSLFVTVGTSDKFRFLFSQGNNDKHFRLGEFLK